MEKLSVEQLDKLLDNRNGKKTKTIPPEVRLWRKVFKRALKDLKHKQSASCSKRKKKQGECISCSWRAQARRWFRYSENHIGSFPSICNILSLNPDHIRTELIRKGLL